MKELRYPWTWLRDVNQGPFRVRFSWFESLRAAVGRRQPVAVLVPEAAGALERWERWLLGALDDDGVISIFSGTPSFRAIEDYFDLDGPIDPPRGTRPWAESSLRAYQRRIGDVRPVPVIAVVSSAEDWSVLEMWIEAQRSMGVELISPVVVSNMSSPSASFLLVRFGAPEILGNLHSIPVFPDADPEFWTSHFLALTVIWECGGLPDMAEDLWTLLRDELPLFDNPHFDNLLNRKLQGFARQNGFPHAPQTIVDEVGFVRAWAKAPRTVTEDDGAISRRWHRGVVTWYDSDFDLTPLVCRALCPSLNDPETHEALRRRRLVNGPVARWLAAWGTTIEEALRMVVLAIGNAKYKQFLMARRAHNPQRFATRYQELGGVAGLPEDATVSLGEFVDLVEFIAKEPLFKGIGPLLDQCRVARNAAVHERVCSAAAILPIVRAVNWLSKQRAI